MPITYQELGKGYLPILNGRRLWQPPNTIPRTFDFQLPVYISGILMNLKHNFQFSRFRTIISLKGFNQIKLDVNVL